MGSETELQAELARLREENAKNREAANEYREEKDRLRERYDAVCQYGDSMRAQRDTLLAALREIRDTKPEVTAVDGDCMYCTAISIARTAISEVEGEKT